MVNDLVRLKHYLIITQVSIILAFQSVKQGQRSVEGRMKVVKVLHYHLLIGLS